MTSTTNNIYNDDNDGSEIENWELVAQDPRTNVTTTTAQTETSHTTIQTSSSLSENARSISHRVIRQTVTQHQNAGISESVIRRTPTKEELEELLGQMSLTITTTTTTTVTGSKNTIEESTIVNQTLGAFSTDKLNPQSTSLEDEISRKTKDTGAKSKLTNKSASQAQKYKSNSTDSKLKPGIAFIFNNEIFYDPKKNRQGGSFEVAALKKTFEELNMKVFTLNNGTQLAISDRIGELVSKNYKNAACLIVVILTYGEENDQLYAKNGCYSLQENIIEPIMNESSLRDVPKVFIIDGLKSTATELSYEDFCQYQDIILFYNQYKRPNTRTETTAGGVFIHRLCEHLQKNGHQKDLETILQDVQLAIKSETNSAQIPNLISTMPEGFMIGRQS